MEVGVDKKKHFVVIFNLMNCVGLWNIIVALVASVVAIGGKEWYDAKHPKEHTAEWGDVVAGLVGVCTSLPLYLFMTLMPMWARVLIVIYLLGVSCAWWLREKLFATGKYEISTVAYCLFSWLYVFPLVMSYLTDKIIKRL